MNDVTLTPREAITSFKDSFRFLSNFWPAQVKLDDVFYDSVEQAYVAAKTTDPAWRNKVRQCVSAAEAKRLGKRIPLRSDWGIVRLGIMENLVRQKFADPELRMRLDLTGDVELVEGNTWGDTFWGVCNGRGENHLGKILMKIRNENRLQHSE